MHAGLEELINGTRVRQIAHVVGVTAASYMQHQHADMYCWIQLQFLALADVHTQTETHRHTRRQRHKHTGMPDTETGMAHTQRWHTGMPDRQTDRFTPRRTQRSKTDNTDNTARQARQGRQTDGRSEASWLWCRKPTWVVRGERQCPCSCRSRVWCQLCKL